MFYAIDFKNEKLGILDTTDKVVEYFTPSEIKQYLKAGVVINGVVLDEKTNPLYTLEGLSVNLAYRTRKKFGKWIVVILKEGDRYGSSLSSTIKTDTVFFYDSSVGWDIVKYPYGQFVASYRLETLVKHDGGLCLDTSVPSWCISGEQWKSIKTWLDNF